ncbi:HAD-IIB family hydrolase [Desulfobacterium sp. N47]|uniref:Mannosyl-3-phosphoglycerate phosphatase n=1 Tax=uncultured Desulfobacterium sp. TaxID=201089 RepID=E1YLY2_9BACT|nr:hypothetical protein N47_E46270 [uncultured Desulfobacterium sp.]
MDLLVFTDLDGTLLNHKDYSYEAAHPALEKIRSRQIPLIFTSSKTRPEIEALQSYMQIREPFIAENGAAVFFPDNYLNFKIDAGIRRFPYTVVQLGSEYSEIRQFMRSIKDRFNLKGFGDLSVEEIALLTGLTPEQALMARQREFTEPFLIEDESMIEELVPIAASQGLKITSGGRFFHLISNRQDKGFAVRICKEIFSRNIGGKTVTVGLGDSANDITMLESVDIPILLPRIDGSFEEIDIHNLIKADKPGSRGWNDAILNVLKNLNERSIDR